MVSRGLLIQEMPSKQIAASGSVDSDIDDLPYPEENENDDSVGNESPDEIELRERRETLQSDDNKSDDQGANLPETLKDTSVQKKPKKLYKSQSHSYNTFEGDSAYGDTPLYMNELQNPRREVLHDLQQPVKQLQLNDSTKLL